MMWTYLSTCFVAVSLLTSPVLASICPDSCICSTSDGLHRATCSSISDLYKFTLRQKHHNINVLDLSHNNLTKISHELDRLTEVVSLDLSTNRITHINKFLHNANKIVHLNLANNRIQELSVIQLPKNVSSLDLTNNLLQDVPSDLERLTRLEHLELEGNPLNCSCENIRARDHLLAANVLIGIAECASPSKFKGRSWLELKTRDVCKVLKRESNLLDMMMGDQPFDAVQVGEENKALKAMSLTSSNILDGGGVLYESSQPEDDEQEFIKVHKSNLPSQHNDMEGSGSGALDTTTDYSLPVQEEEIHPKTMSSDELSPADIKQSTDDPIEASGYGSGFGAIDHEESEQRHEETTPYIEPLEPRPIERLFDDDNNLSSTEFPLPKLPSIFEGGPNWLNSHTEPPVVTQKPVTPQIALESTISQKVTKELESKSSDNDKTAPHKTGTYVCIAIIVVLLVGLVGFAIIKNQMRKRRDRRLLRQQKRDIEKASKEMVDMNKSLLGKPAVLENPIDKKVNGKYELVPTHEMNQKKSENGGVANGVKHADTNGTNGLRTDSPRDTNQNKSSSKDHNLVSDKANPVQDISFESTPDSADSRKDGHSLSSEEIFVSTNDRERSKTNGKTDSELSHPLINGDQLTDSDFLTPSREYVPVYSPDMGRVRIKMAEMPKPKTPILVTRSRSNAGDIIITPSLDGNMRKSTT